MLLLFHRYVLHGNEPMKELEDTFLYSYAEMLIGRTMVISIYMLGVLACLSIVLHHIGREAFLRLALCGAAPSVYLCVLLLLLAGSVGVGAEGEACIVVAQHAADRLYVYTVLESYCGEGVSEGVQGDVLQVGILEDLFVEFCYGVGMVHLTGGG